jgi:hypothetical protein
MLLALGLGFCRYPCAQDLRSAGEQGRDCNRCFVGFPPIADIRGSAKFPREMEHIVQRVLFLLLAAFAMPLAGPAIINSTESWPT